MLKLPKYQESGVCCQDSKASDAESQDFISGNIRSQKHSITGSESKPSSEPFKQKDMHTPPKTQQSGETKSS